MSTIATTISDIGSLLGGLGSMGAVILLVFTKRGVSQVHELVNDRATKQDRRIDQLTDTLVASDTDVPPRHPNGEEVT